MITASTEIKTAYGLFKVNYHLIKDNGFCISLTRGDVTSKNTLVRVHSSCLFSESFHTIDCDCNLQLENSMKLISSENSGIIVYSYEEGRGVGLENKIKALEVQRSKGLDTAQAFEELHFEVDPRRYYYVIEALHDLKVNKEIRLITNNPRKISQLADAGFNITDTVQLRYQVNSEIKEYLRVKKNKLGHTILDDLLR